jgi:hypothetical protein
VGVSAVIPIPQQPTLIISMASGLGFGTLFLSFGIGRLVKFVAMGFLAAESPHTLFKAWPSLRIKLRELGYDDEAFKTRTLPRPMPATQRT